MSRTSVDGEEHEEQDVNAAEAAVEDQAAAVASPAVPVDVSVEAEADDIRRQQRQDMLRQETEDYAAQIAAESEAAAPAAAIPGLAAMATSEPAATPASAPERTYTVQPGDSLSAIALAIYGDVGRWPEILAANSDVVADANLIYPGQVLRIP